jgi:integrase
MAQKGHIFRAGNFWFLRYRDNFNVDGKIVRKQKCEKLAEVCDRYRRESDLGELVEERMAGIKAAAKCPQACNLFSDYVETVWLPHIENTRKASTYSGYKTYFERYIRPHVEKQGLAVRDFNVRVVSDLLKTVAKMYPVNRDTILKIHSVLSGIFRYALATGAFPGKTATDNPCAGALIPKGKKKQETKAATFEDVQAFLAAMKKKPHERAAIALAAFTGCRPGELRGLRWEDWDRKQQHISIRRAVWHKVVGDTKTEQSKSFVAVTSSLRGILLELHKVQGEPIAGYFLAGQKGQPVILDNLSKRSIAPTIAAYSICATCRQEESAEHVDHEFERAPLRWEGFYSLRRFHATQVCVQADSETAASALRNSKEVAKDNYIKPTTVLPKTRQAVNDAMSGLIN